AQGGRHEGDPHPAAAQGIGWSRPRRLPRRPWHQRETRGETPLLAFEIRGHAEVPLGHCPIIPESFERRRLIQEAIIRTRAPAALAMLVANLTGAITDNRMWNYQVVHDPWRLSNSEGFARWFESRMKLAKVLMENRALQAKAAKVDDLPAYRWKSPLQTCVKLLKRHRDTCSMTTRMGNRRP